MNGMKVLIGAAVATLAISFSGTAGARPKNTSNRTADYQQCVADNGYYDRYMCCEIMGGAWVEIDNDEDGQAEDEYCEIDGKPADRESRPAPKPRPAPKHGMYNGNG